MVNYISDAVVKGAGAQDQLAFLAEQARGAKQENDIRAHEVKAYDELAALKEKQASETPVGTQGLAQAVVPQDLDGDYAKLFTANQAVAQGKVKLEQLQQQLGVAPSKEFDKYKKLYDAEKAKYDEAEKEKQKITTQHLDSILSAGLSIDEQGNGYDLFRNEFIAHDLAAAKANGVPEEGLQRRRAFLEQQLPEKYDAKAKVGVSEIMKHSRSLDDQLKIEAKENLRTHQANMERIQEQNARSNQIKAAAQAAKGSESALTLKSLEAEHKTVSGQLGKLRSEESRLLKLQAANPEDQDVKESLAEVSDKIKFNEGEVNRLRNELNTAREMDKKNPKPTKTTPPKAGSSKDNPIILN